MEITSIYLPFGTTFVFLVMVLLQDGLLLYKKMRAKGNWQFDLFKAFVSKMKLTKVLTKAFAHTRILLNLLIYKNRVQTAQKKFVEGDNPNEENDGGINKEACNHAVWVANGKVSHLCLRTKFSLFKPSNPWGGGDAVRPLWFLPFTQKIFLMRRHLCKKKKYPRAEHFWDTQYKDFF